MKVTVGSLEHGPGAFFTRSVAVAVAVALAAGAALAVVTAGGGAELDVEPALFAGSSQAASAEVQASERARAAIDRIGGSLLRPARPKRATRADDRVLPFAPMFATPDLRSISALVMTISFAVAGCGAQSRPDGGSGLLPVGSAVPDLVAPDQHGKSHRISEERGRPLVVFFYPRDNTPGCTKEACAFRDAWDRYQKANVAIFGVSADDQKSHESFAKEQKLPFPILADPAHAWSSAFGVPTRLGMASRVTFLLDASGKIAKAYPDVDPGVHAEQVLKDASALAAAPSKAP